MPAANPLIRVAGLAVPRQVVAREGVGPLGRVDLPGEFMRLVYPAFGARFVLGPLLAVRTAAGEKVGAVVVLVAAVLVGPGAHVLR